VSECRAPDRELIAGCRTTAIIEAVSSAAEALPDVPFEAFLDGEVDGAAGDRHEWVGGRVFVMTGGSERHDLAAGLVYEALAPAARRSGCRPFTSNRLLRVARSAYYPDVFVVCGPAAHRLYEDDARLIVEVLSPSTSDVDRREKAAAYLSLPGLRAYLLIEPDRPRVEVAVPRRDGVRWAVHGPGSVVLLDDWLPGAGVLDLDQLHATLASTATTA
jgi:Uma2 family endonuclease